MAVSILSQNSITTNASEQNLLSIAEQAPGIYILTIDANAMQAGDTIVVRLKEKVRAASTSRTRVKTTVSGAQDPAVLSFGPIEITHELQATIQRTAGVDRAFDWQIRRIG